MSPSTKRNLTEAYWTRDDIKKTVIMFKLSSNIPRLKTHSLFHPLSLFNLALLQIKNPRSVEVFIIDNSFYPMKS